MLGGSANIYFANILATHNKAVAIQLLLSFNRPTQFRSTCSIYSPLHAPYDPLQNSNT